MKNYQLNHSMLIAFFSLLTYFLFKKKKYQVPFQTIFQKQHSDDLDTSSSGNKKKLAKIVVECRKEGIVNYIPPESLDLVNQTNDNNKWEKCRLVLVKTVSGYMLEFYSPPKAPKVRSRVTFRDFFFLQN